MCLIQSENKGDTEFLRSKYRFEKTESSVLLTGVILCNAVADPGFDLRGEDFVNGRGGDRKLLKVLKVEVKVIFIVFWPNYAKN